jgi:siroheme synthase-like protein
LKHKNKNTLYPIFLKLNKLDLLIVGGGNVGLEKVSFILKNSPDAKITMIATYFLEEVKKLVGDFNVKLIERAFEEKDLEGRDIVICATDNYELHQRIVTLNEDKKTLTNVADTPELCDFYLSSIVSRGDLKIAISTNGKSPTLGKRIRQYLEDALPDNTQSIIDGLKEFRDTLKGDFESKVKALNEVTKKLSNRND